MKRALILQHEPETPPGTTLEWLAKNQFSTRVLMCPETAVYPSLDSFDALVICGGSMNVDQEQQHTWLKTEKEFIKSCLRASKPILGLCLGSQLIAEVLGATVGPMGLWEIGWFDVQYKGANIPAFHWHQYNFTLPQDATLIASSAACAHQGYLYKNHVAAFQFHPEVDEEWIRLSLQDFDGNMPGAVQTPQKILEKNSQYLPLAKQWYFDFLDKHFSSVKSP